MVLLNLVLGYPDPLAWPSLEPRRASVLWKPEPRLPLLLYTNAHATRDETSPARDFVELMDRYPGWIVLPKSARFPFIFSFGEKWDQLKLVLENHDRKIAQPAWLAFMRYVDIQCTLVPAIQLSQLRSCLETWDDATDEWFELARRYLAHLRYYENWQDHQEWLDKLLQTRAESELRQAYLRREQALCGHTL